MNKDILILNCTLVNYNFDDGRSISKNKVEYALKMRTDDEKFKGLSTLVCNLDVSTFNEVSKYCGRSVKAIITEFPIKNGSKYMISSINGVEL